jgi:hypothetical protein
MKKQIVTLSLLAFASSAFAQNFLTDGDFEKLPAGNKSYITNTNGRVNGKPNQWQLAIAPGNCPDGCGGANSEIVSDTKQNGNNSLKIEITKQTNRNDIRLFQSMLNVPAGKYEISFFAKSLEPNALIAGDVLKGTQPSPNNGQDPFTGNFKVGTDWTLCKFTVDLSSWTAEELKEPRLSIRPNSNKALPVGPYPKTFWIDNVVFQSVK